MDFVYHLFCRCVFDHSGIKHFTYASDDIVCGSSFCYLAYQVWFVGTEILRYCLIFGF